MARPKKENAKIQVNVMLEPEIIQDIDKLAKKIKSSRSQFVRNLIHYGLDDVKLLDKSGLLGFFALGRDAIKKAMNTIKLDGLDVLNDE